MKNGLLQKHAAFGKVSYVSHCPGHRNSKGELAEWCIKDHKDNHIINSFKSEEAAKSGLKNMESHKGSATGAAPMRRRPDYGVEASTSPILRSESLSASLTAALKCVQHNKFACDTCEARLERVYARLEEPRRKFAGTSLERQMRLALDACVKGDYRAPIMAKAALAKAKAVKLSFGYYNFTWSGNDVILFGPDKKSIHLSGQPALDFQEQLNKIEEKTPNSEDASIAVNELIAQYFEAERTKAVVETLEETPGAPEEQTTK